MVTRSVVSGLPDLGVHGIEIVLKLCISSLDRFVAAEDLLRRLGLAKTVEEAVRRKDARMGILDRTACGRIVYRLEA
jgi:hypothetical protein